MILRRTRGILATTATTALLLGLGACTTDDEPSTDPTPTAEPTHEPEEDPDEAAVRDVVGRFWAAYVDLEQNPPGDPDAFTDIIAPPGIFIEQYRARAADYADRGITRPGKPDISDPVLDRNKLDEYLVSQCFDESSWHFERDGEVREIPEGRGINRRDLTVERLDDRWLIADMELRGKEDPCPT